MAAGTYSNERVKVAVIDGASFVLPYDLELVRQLGARGTQVEFHASRTAYNPALLDDIAGLPGTVVRRYDVSRTVAPRWRAAAEYTRLWLRVLAGRRRLALVNLQFSIVWPLELAAAWMLRRRFVLTVHNAVPHGWRGLTHRPTRFLARAAGRLVFPSRHTHDDFLRRYGEHYRAKAALLPHAPMPVLHGSPAEPYRPLRAPQALAFWGNVKPYKGVDLFAELAGSPALRELGIRLEIHGAWDLSMRSLRDRLAGLGVAVADEFLSSAELLKLLARPVLFLLPYREATQSGALYTLLHHGCYFACADVGDLGAFMRGAGLERLLLRDRTAASVLACLDAFRAEPDRWALRFAAARDAARADSDRAVGAAYAP